MSGKTSERRRRPFGSSRRPWVCFVPHPKDFLVLGEQATVYITGRSMHGGPPPIDRISGTIEDTAEEVTRRGGVSMPVQIDHADAEQNKNLFDRVRGEHSRLDVFARAVWGGNARFVDLDTTRTSKCPIVWLRGSLGF
jgi:hypothetical protein